MFVVAALLVGLVWWQHKREDQAREWPTTEATIEGGSFETVGTDRDEPLQVPVLSFSYHIAGEYRSGRVALIHFFDDSGAEIIRQMTGQKLQIHYDPQDATKWFIDARIAGCRIKQEGLKSEASRSF